MSEEQAKSLVTVTQAITPSEFSTAHQELLKFVNSQLKETKTGENGDYGVIPYTKKKSLLKPGAEKLAKLFGLSISYEKMAEVENWEKGFVYYKYKCTLTHFASGKFVGDAVRSCNNKEKKHASKSVYDVANTIEAVAQKRALVAAVVAATNASDIFDAEQTSEYETEAPNRSVKAEEDPRRQRLFAKLYASAQERGFGDVALHNAAKRIYHVHQSLNELSNTEIEGFIEKLLLTYEEVGKGNKPRKLYEAIQEEVKEDEEKGDAIEAEVVNSGEEVKVEELPEDLGEETKLRVCPNPLNLPDCKKVIAEDDTHDVCSICRLQEFIKNGSLKKGVGSDKKGTTSQAA